ncbi:MAG TPA: anhydro-N-acetylmuramic acid kinase [Acidimicrobiales bacterium]|nr:anhydro-N-acetylmuramic acid kinase [Acidimicrobiales bacterium]
MRVIGMISGTSFDAVEALLTEIRLEDEIIACELIEHRSVPYPQDLRDAIAAILPPSPTTIEQVCRLDVAIGQFFAVVAAELADAHGGVDAVCSHGQTVYHWVDGNVAKGTLQLGEPAWIAERTGAVVVSDVRNRDIAAGGHGAPLASLLDVLLLGRNPAVPTGSLNLGGIANITVVGPGREPVAFDIGPANALLDASVEWLSNGRVHYDQDGGWAAGGTVDAPFVARLLDDPYFALPPPKSTGKEYFNLDYVKGRLRGSGPAGQAPSDAKLSDADLLASITAATAEMVAQAVRRFDVRELLVAGGGTRNLTLMGELQARLPGVDIRRTDEAGVPEASKEALLFAIIGFLSLSGLPATVPSSTGARHASVLGSVTPGHSAWWMDRPRMARAPVDRPPASPGALPRPPTRLVVRSNGPHR